MKTIPHDVEEGLPEAVGLSGLPTLSRSSHSISTGRRDRNKKAALASHLNRDGLSDPVGCVDESSATTGSLSSTGSSSFTLNVANTTVHSKAYRFLHEKTLLPDNSFHIHNIKIVDGPAGVKLLKFAALTYLSIYVMFETVRWIDWENDPTYTFKSFWQYESADVAMDVLFFYIVGRLYNQRGVDHLAWVLAVIFSNVFYCSITNVWFMQHSITWYEMRYKWPWQLWVFVLCVLPVFIVALLFHIREAHEEKILVMKGVELAICLGLFLVSPLMQPPERVHLHHWFNSFLLGMHANFDVWWSRLCMAWCWGLYVNGIAVYGRDPVVLLSSGSAGTSSHSTGVIISMPRRKS